MVVPPFVGQDVVRATPGLADDKGYVPVEDTYQSKAYPEIYAVGIAAQVPVPWHTAVPIGIPTPAGAGGGDTGARAAVRSK